MTDFVRARLRRITIRARLTMWYILLMGLTFILFSGYLLFRFQRSLMNSIDTAIQVSVSQAISSLGYENGRLVLQETEEDQIMSRLFTTQNFAMRILSPSGTVWDTIGPFQVVSVWGAGKPGFSTQSLPGDNEQWRIYSHPILSTDGQIIGWLQAAQSLETMTDTLQDFRDQFLWSVPLILLLAGVGGYFLAGRALRPIDNITRTAHEIGAGDISYRIGYQGPQDEVGRLARTFDRMLERLQAAFEQERRFTGDAAHELRTPLTALKGQIEVTLNRPRKRSEYENTLRGMVSQVDRLIRLSNALLFLSLSDQNRLSWEPAQLNLGDLLDVIIEQIHPLADERNLSLTAQIPAELPVYGDTDHLIRLFLNLLDNAIKYTPTGGQITLKAERKTKVAQIVIHNTGPGIPKQHLSHMFDRFYRVGDDRSSETGGSGLGLTIAHEIVRLHGGEISVQSEPMQGVTFTLQLPAIYE